MVLPDKQYEWRPMPAPYSTTLPERAPDLVCIYEDVSPPQFPISKSQTNEPGYSYINGTAIHGIEPESASKPPDTNRLEFLQKALDNASLLIRTQFESDNFRRRLRYTLVCCIFENF